MPKNRLIALALAIFLLFGTSLNATGRTNSTEDLPLSDSDLLTGQYNVTIDTVSTFASGRSYATLKFDNDSLISMQINPTSQVQTINMLTILNSIYWGKEKVSVYIIDGYISAVVESNVFTGLSTEITAKTAPSPVVRDLPDNIYNTTIGAVYSTNDGRNYAYLNSNGDTLKSSIWVQFNPTSQLQAINMLTMLNSAYWEQKNVIVTVKNGYISTVSDIERPDNVST
ncbi:hypothetical protein ACSAZL_06460 [Methanosarcina sp. T3]|uniref:hypothetical protein n=1 Tax=Methanosarcina sp. T3 TaxID=3439062 RepID=UPI003F8328D9